VRDFTGRKCAALVAREFWLGERCVSRACYVFLSLSDGTSVGWWFNDDPEVWQSESIDAVPAPATEEEFTLDGTQWRYPHVDLASQLGVRGRSLSRWVARSAGPVPEARLEFADGSAVVFGYDCRSDSDWVQVTATQTPEA